MKRNIFLSVLLLSGALASCNKEVDAPINAEEPEVPVVQGDFSISASSGPVSKTEMDGERYITWKSGDAISVWEAGNASNSNVQLSLNASTSGERIGKFTGALTPASDDFTLYAIYPYSSSYSADPTALSVSLPTAVSQTASVNGLVGVSDFMLGTANLSSSDEQYEMLFTYPLTILDIVVDGSGSCLSGATAESLTITANTPFVGAASVDLTTGALTPANDAAGKSLVINYPSTATIASAQHTWVAIYPVDLTDASCCFDLKMTNGQEIKFNVNPKKAFEAQKIYTINLTNIDVHVDEGKANPIFFDLVGANGGSRANCYIVSEGGYYRFAAQKVDKTNVFEGSAPNSDGYRANWLWSEGASTLVDFVSIGNSGNINFRVQAGARGNALLALFDSSSKIIWSWHIWMTDPDILEPTHWSRNSAWSLANCNIGALSNEEGDLDSYGLYYQWGRKDPFPGSNTTGQSSSSKEGTSFNTFTKAYVINPSYSSVTFSSVRNTVAGAVDEIAYSIEHPTTFIHYNANNSTTGKTNTWFYKTPVADAQALWNSTTTKAAKTNYDPCPPGWTVPVGNSYAWNASADADKIVFFNNVTAESNANLSGFIYSPTVDNCSYYPACGYRAAGQLCNVGYVAYYWSAITNATNSDGTFTAYGLCYEGRGTKQNAGNRFQTAWALPVRCMKI